MARIIGGIGTSHVPTIGMAFDRGKNEDPDWKPLFEQYRPLQSWLAQKKPDVVVYFYNDHATTFFFDHYPTFALGVSDSFPTADEGMGQRPVPRVRGHAPLARHMANSLINQEFDISVFQDLPLDHGCNSPMTMLFPNAVKENAWPVAMIPIEVNVLQHPVPTPMRCWKLGQAVRRAIETFPEDLKVIVAGTGGLSHQMGGERAGFNDTDWDEQFLDLIHRDPERLTAMRLADYAILGGTEGAEVIMWLAMRGALSRDVKKLHSAYYLAMTTTMAVALFEEPGLERAKLQPEAV